MEEVKQEEAKNETPKVPLTLKGVMDIEENKLSEEDLNFD
jgi:hypothetical protein